MPAAAGHPDPDDPDAPLPAPLSVGDHRLVPSAQRRAGLRDQLVTDRLRVNGLTRNDVKEDRSSSTQAMDKIKDGNLDATRITVGHLAEGLAHDVQAAVGHPQRAAFVDRGRLIERVGDALQPQT